MIPLTAVTMHMETMKTRTTDQDTMPKMNIFLQKKFCTFLEDLEWDCSMFQIWAIYSCKLQQKQKGK